MKRLLYESRCRLGAWLLREHVAALCEHYTDVARANRLKGNPEKGERCDYMGIGVRYGVGIGTPWRRFDDEQAQLARAAREVMEHAKDAL